MFYSQEVLARRGPLGLVWLAAHMQHQLKRNQITSTQLAKAVEAVLDPGAPLALRLSGQLLLGLARLFDKQVMFLHQDCNDALLRIRLAFHTTAGSGLQAPHTLPEAVGANVAGGAAGHRRVGAALLDADDGPSQALRDGPGPSTAAAASWCLLVDMVEAQLVAVPGLQAGSGALLAAELQLATVAGDGRAAAVLRQRRASLSLGSGGVGKRGSHGVDGEDDTQGVRDQTTGVHGYSVSPAPSRATSQADTLFAPVATAHGVTSVSFGALPSVSQPGLATGGRSASRNFLLPAATQRLPPPPEPSTALMLPGSDEVFDMVPDDPDNADLLGELLMGGPGDGPSVDAVEVEVLRDAPSSGPMRGRNLLADLLGPSPGVVAQTPALGLLAGMTPSTAGKRPALADTPDGGSGGGMSRQGSVLALRTARPPPTASRMTELGSRGTGGDGLMDMGLDIGALPELLGMPEEALMATDDVPPGAGTGSPASERHAGVVRIAGAALTTHLTARARTRAQALMERQAGPTARLPPLPPTPSAAAAPAAAKPGPRRGAAVRMRTAPAAGSRLLLLPRRPMPMDSAGRDSGQDPSMVRASDFKGWVNATRELTTERGLVVYRRQQGGNKRTRVVDDLAVQQSGLAGLLEGWSGALAQLMEAASKRRNSALDGTTLPATTPSAATGRGDGASTGEQRDRSQSVHGLDAPARAAALTIGSALQDEPHASLGTAPAPDAHVGALGLMGRVTGLSPQPSSAPRRPLRTIQLESQVQAGSAAPDLCFDADMGQENQDPAEDLGPASLHKALPKAHATTPSPRPTPPQSSRGNHPGLDDLHAGDAGLGLGSQQTTQPRVHSRMLAAAVDTPSDRGPWPAPLVGASGRLDSGGPPVFLRMGSVTDGRSTDAGGSRSSAEEQLRLLATRTQQTLQRLTQAMASQLPSDAHAQLMTQGPSWLGCADGNGSPASSQAARVPQPSTGVVPGVAPDTLSQLTALPGMPLTQLAASPTGGVATRLQASRCFFDVLTLCSRGLVALSQDMTTTAAPSTVPIVRLTQRGVDASLGTQPLHM